MSNRKNVMLKICMYPAGNGDAFLITYEDRNSVSILIDGGYSTTFQDAILPDLRYIANSGGRLDLVIATHIDADHISGLLQFFKMNGSAADPQIIPVHKVWHNSLRSINPLINSSFANKELGKGDQNILLEIGRRGYPEPSNKESKTSEISARQGSSLAGLLLENGYTWNEGHGLEAISVSINMHHELNSNLTATVIGPTVSRLQDLGEWWITELRRLGFTGSPEATKPYDDAFEFMSAISKMKPQPDQQLLSGSAHTDRELSTIHVPDTSLTNASSIALILRLGLYRMLFLGDSFPADIVGILEEKIVTEMKSKELPILFDAIKISHHGSNHNTSPALLDLIDSPIYLISSSGERHNHPDIEVLKAIVDRPGQFHRHLYFNYCTPASEWMKEYVNKSTATFSVSEGIQEVLIPDWLRHND